jgi:hypothetical protein
VGVLPVPHTQPWFMGVANLRGGLHGVVDLAASWACASPLARDACATRPGCWPSTQPWAALRGAGRPPGRPAQCRAADVPTADGSRARPLPAALYRTPRVGRWQEIDLAALARTSSFWPSPHEAGATFPCTWSPPGCPGLSDEEDDMSFLDRIKAPARKTADDAVVQADPSTSCRRRPTRWKPRCAWATARCLPDRCPIR